MRSSRIILLAAAFAGLLLVPAASGDKGGVDRPFTATLSGAAHWEFPGVSPSNCQVVTTMTESTGQVAHLGRVTASWSHCPAEPDYVLDGRLVMVAANGDELYGAYDYDGGNVVALTFTGGTGRFAHASGAADVAYDTVPQLVPGCTDPDDFACLDFSVPWPWYATLSGTITY